MFAFDLRNWRFLLAASLVLTIPAWGGCAFAQPASTELTTVRLGLVGIAPESAIRMGVERGVFKEEGIDLQLTNTGASADVISALIGGSFDIGTGGPTTVLVAAARGLPVRVFSALNQAPESDSDVGHRASAIMVTEGSAIKSPQDLMGKKLAVNALKGVGEIAIRDWMAKNGADGSKIQFVELRFPDMQAALKAGHVDAVWHPEPFVAIGTGAGLRIVGVNPEALVPGATLGVFFCTAAYYEKSPAIIEKFRRAMEKAAAYANAHPEEVRQELQDFGKMSPALAEKLALPTWGTRTHLQSLNLLNDRLVEFGVIKQKADLKVLMGSSPTR
jgi:NitT/TauT family transport system substrate-binding protein